MKYLLLPILIAASLPASAAVVTTRDNTSTAGDGQISLLEAITDLADNETISFNIPGAGPHYILTPDAGYPLVTKSGVIIDGYSQPGAAANTSTLRRPNNAALKIVLDSRTSDAVANPRRRVIDFPGFGTSESCVIGLMDAKDCTIRGLAFIGVPGGDSDENPYVYNIALIKESSSARVQGCWFGLDPATSSWAPDGDGRVSGVHGARSAVASFGWEGQFSSRLIFGTDSDGIKDNGEFNISTGQLLAIHLETPDARVSGNWFNFLPDGSVFDYRQLALSSDFEAIENGNGERMLIGTNGDGINDLNEGNFFGPVKYDNLCEFWRPAMGVVIAGNYVGVGLDGWPAYKGPDNFGLAVIRKNSSFRIGSDRNGTGDAAEANHIYGLGASFLSWHGSNNEGPPSTPARISLRGNELIDNFGSVPLNDGINVSPSQYFRDVLLDPSENKVLLLAGTTTRLRGIVPEKDSSIITDPVMLDVYLADAAGLSHTADPFTNGYIQGRVLLATYEVNGPADLAPGVVDFEFDVAALNLTAAELPYVTATANYRLPDGTIVTSNFASPTGAPFIPPAALGVLNITRAGTGLLLRWSDGIPPFLIQTAPDLTGPWAGLTTTWSQSFTATSNGPRRFYRVREGANPR